MSVSIETLLLAKQLAGSGGGGTGGTDNYADLSHKPSINGVELSGNKTAAALGLGTYTKPSGGIPASDIASGVIPTVPTNISSFTNDSGYLTLATLPLYDGSVSSVSSETTY